MALKKGFMVAATAAIIAVSAVGCNVKTDTPVIGKIVGLSDDQALKIGNSICTVDEVKLVLMNLQNQYKEDLGGQVSWTQKLGDTTLEEFILDKVESDLSIIYAMSSLAGEKEITLSDEENKMIEQAAEEYYSALNESEKKYSNASKETIASLYKNYYLSDKIYNQETEGISSSVSDEEARVIKIQCIYIDTGKTKAEDANTTLKQVKNQVENGSQDFLVQANKYSDNKTVEFNLKKNEATEDYQVKAFELGDGQISEVISQNDGLYLVKCVKSYLEKETLENKEKIIMDSKINVFSKIYNTYTKENSNDINSKVWEQLEFSSDENVKANNLFEVYDKYMK